MKHLIYLMALILTGLSINSHAAEPKGKAARGKVKHIVFVGLDGWGAFSMAKAQMPTVRALMAQGCWTLQKRTVNPSSSAPNWASMFMGAGPELHGYTKWGSQRPEVPSRVVLKHNIFPTIFQLLRDARPQAEIGVLYDWDGIKYLVDTLSLSYHAQSPDYQKQPEALTDMAVNYIRTKQPTLLAVCYDNPDHVGHQIGFGSPEYYAELELLDGRLARIIDATRQAGIYDETVFIVLSDHGGIKKGHGGITLQEVETPFIIAGQGIRRGGEFSESMMQYDVAATMAHMLGLTPPQVWIGRPMMQVFER